MPVFRVEKSKKNAFDVDRYLAAMRRRQRQVVTQEEVFDFYEIDLSDDEETGEAEAAEE